jgi:hypothetical protein
MLATNLASLDNDLENLAIMPKSRWSPDSHVVVNRLSGICKQFSRYGWKWWHNHSDFEGLSSRIDE